jgi:glycosyltransferase 2 family protein
MREKIKSSIKIVISLAGIGIIFFVFRNRFGDVWHILVQCNKQVFAGALSVYFIAVLLISTRLKFSFRIQGLQCSVRTAWKLTFLGYFFNLFLPSSIGGDVAKIYYAIQTNNEKAKSFIAVFLDRIIGFLSLITLCVVAIVVFHEKIQLPHALGVIIFFSVCAILLVIFFSSKRVASLFSFAKYIIPSKKIREKIRRLYFLMYACREHKKPLFYAIALSFVFQIVSIFSYYLLARALSLNVTLEIFYFLIPVIFVVSLLPSINGLGVREGAFIYFFSMFITSENAFALSLLADVLLYSASLVGYVVYLMSGKVNYKDMSQVVQGHEPAVT